MKFNQGMYAKMRAKKNEPFSNLGKRTMRVVEKGVSVTLATPDTETMRIASSATSVEEITPLWKKQHMADKGKDKADSYSSSVWDNTSLMLAKAQEAFTAEELKVFSCMSFNEVMGRHIHKLVQVVYLCSFTLFFFFFLHCSKGWILFSGARGESVEVGHVWLELPQAHVHFKLVPFNRISQGIAFQKQPTLTHTHIYIY